MDVVGLHVGWGRDNTREAGFNYNKVCVCVWGGVIKTRDNKQKDKCLWSRLGTGEAGRLGIV